MASTKGSTKDKEATSVASNGDNGKARPRAAVESIDFSESVAAEDLHSVIAQRKSPWGELLNQLYDETAKEDSKAPRHPVTNELLFVKLGTFNNVGGARTQIKAFEGRGLDQTYDFKSTTAGKQSFLWARVKEVAE